MQESAETMSIAEAAEALGLHGNTVRSYVIEGILAGEVFTLPTGYRKIRVSRASVRRLKERGLDHAAND